MEGNRKLKGVKGPELSAHRMLTDEFSGNLIMNVCHPNRDQYPRPDIAQESSTEDSKVGAGEGSGPDLAGEPGKHLDGGKPGDRNSEAASVRIRWTFGVPASA